MKSLLGFFVRSVAIALALVIVFFFASEWLLDGPRYYGGFSVVFMLANGIYLYPFTISLVLLNYFFVLWMFAGKNYRYLKALGAVALFYLTWYRVGDQGWEYLGWYGSAMYLTPALMIVALIMKRKEISRYFAKRKQQI